MKKKIALSVFISLMFYGTVARGIDVCDMSVPTSLRKAIKKQFPFHRIATSGDQCTKDDKEWDNLYCRNDRCQTVASGDFDGNKEKDFALYLVKKNSNVPILIVALRRGKSWLISELPQWSDSILGCYVEPVKPGRYKHAKSSAFEPDDANEKEKVKAEKTSIKAGEVESMGVVYVYHKGKWLYVLVSD
jgi:hypothetical protein